MTQRPRINVHVINTQREDHISSQYHIRIHNYLCYTDLIDFHETNTFLEGLDHWHFRELRGLRSFVVYLDYKNLEYFIIV
jgi:hypothetical protein